MRIRLLVAASLAVLSGLTSCDRSERTEGSLPATAPAFSHALTADLSGYYLPTGEVRFGQWSFDHVFIGQAQEFQAWEGGTRSGTFAPVMLQFDDVASPMIQTEIGEARSVTARVLPTTYSVTDSRVRFSGHSPELGAVHFVGVIDAGALATSRRNLGEEGVVVVGTLKVGDAPAQGVRLRWWAGD